MAFEVLEVGGETADELLCIAMVWFLALLDRLTGESPTGLKFTFGIGEVQLTAVWDIWRGILWLGEDRSDIFGFGELKLCFRVYVMGLGESSEKLLLFILTGEQSSTELDRKTVGDSIEGFLVIPAEESLPGWAGESKLRLSKCIWLRRIS